MRTDEEVVATRNGICVGSEMAGGVENIVVTNNTVETTGAAIYFKSNLDRGAYVKDVVVDGLNAGRAGQCVKFDNNYHGARGGNFPTLFQNYTISNVRCGHMKSTALVVDGLPQMPVRDVVMKHVHVEQAAQATDFKNTVGFEFVDVTVNGKAVPAPK